MKNIQTMKSALLLAPGKFSLTETPIPDVQKGEMLVQVQTCCLCGSDLRTFLHGNSRTKFPAVIGHEISGIIARTGENCRFQTGEKVALGADLPVSGDIWSESGHPNLAEPNIALGYQKPGGLAEYCLIDADTCQYGPVCKIPEKLDFDSAALAEPIACCINACENTGIKPGDNILIFGAGPVGLLLARACLAFGADLVVLTDPEPERIALAQKAGLNNSLLLPENITELQQPFNLERNGFDAVFTACISPAAIKPALESTAKRGRLCLFAGYPQAYNMNINPNIIHYRELTICGAHGSTPAQHRKAVELLANGKIKAADLITHHFPLEEIEKAIKTAQNRRCLKIAIHP
jgi:L-iditol 2-dehydrogenase